MIKKILAKKLTWWKFIIIQFIGIFILVLIIKLGIDKSFVSNDELLEEETTTFLNLVSTESDWEVMPNEETCSYINNVKGHKEEEMIVGHFFGNSKDTLRIESSEIEYTFKVVSSNPYIPILRLENTICPLLVNEGDLDRNGTTEVGILDTWHTSSCRLYRIYTLKNNQWYYLIAPLKTSENIRASGVELAEPTELENKIRIRYANFEAPLSSCANSPIIDTIVSASFIPIELKL